MNDVRALVRTLQVALVLAFVLALGGAFLPGRIGTASSVACIAVLIGAAGAARRVAHDDLGADA